MISFPSPAGVLPPEDVFQAEQAFNRVESVAL
jgi:hypothetical protein